MSGSSTAFIAGAIMTISAALAMTATQDTRTATSMAAPRPETTPSTANPPELTAAPTPTATTTHTPIPTATTTATPPPPQETATRQAPQAHFGRLTPGEEPPQFVVFSWDGGASPTLQKRFRNVMAEVDGHMTIFLTGIYFLPNDLRTEYKPPGRRVGASDIPFPATPDRTRQIITSVTESALAGHEIGTHFNGHFCGKRGVTSWSSEMWRSEIDQAVSFVADYKKYTGFNDMPDLPFDYRTQLFGSRTPCLQGQKNLLPVAAELGWKYDSSGVGAVVWPKKFDGLQVWDIPLQRVPWKGSGKVISMDYNYMVRQNGDIGAKVRTKQVRYGNEMRDSLLAGLDLAMTSNRAPLIIGNHFNSWNGGVYMDAVEQVMRESAARPGVRLVSFEELVTWLEAQDPVVLAKLQALDEGQSPPGGWTEYLR